MRRKPEPLDRIAVQYAGYVSRGIVLQVRNGEIEISTPEGTVTEMLRSEVDKNKAALIQHIESLAKHEPIYIEAPPHRFVKWAIAELQRKLAKGEYAVVESLTWLEAMDNALAEAETVRIEILSAADLDSKLNELVF